MRLFTCTLLGEDNRAFYDEHVAALVRASGGLLRPIPRSTAHLTYAFLPAVSDEDFGRLVAAIDALERRAPITIRLGRPKVLYARRQPRLVCVDVVSDGHELAVLAETVVGVVKRACPASRLDAARSMHVTLARFRRDAARKDGQTVESVLATSSLSTEREETVSRIDVVESSLTPAGPVYTVRHSA
jgi:2'-5' RNA ligase